MKKLQTILILAGGFSLIFVSSLIAQTNITGSVVKIYTEYSRHSYYSPWEMRGRNSVSGSGCVINGNRILTNAHVVGDSKFIQVKRAGSAKKYTAEVKIVAHECDLAILEVMDKTFFSDINPLKIGVLPELKDKVIVYGFPSGGDELCVTEGVVSRVEHHQYVHSRANLLSCQIDAAINPGNSGGPVIIDDNIVGVAFQAGTGENIGYMVPVPVINHFLKDIEDGKYDGIPSLGFSWQELENPDMRFLHGMGENHTGVLVNKIYADSPAKGVLKSGDVIISIEGENITNDGTVEFRKNERTFFGHVIQNKYIDDIAEFEILRDNKVMNVKVKLSIPMNYCRLVPYKQFDIAPTYYIVGGLVFEPLALNYLSELWGLEDAPSNLANYYYNGETSDTRREVIVLISILADEINVGYRDFEDNVISYANGREISCIKDLVKAVEENKGKYHIFVDEWGNKIVLDRKKADKRNELILRKYKVNSQRSEDLKKF